MNKSLVVIHARWLANFVHVNFCHPYSFWMNAYGTHCYVPKPAQGGYTPPNALQLRGGVYPPRQPRARCSSSGGGSPPPQVMRNAYASWYIMHIDGYACISMDVHAYRWICMHIHGYACISMDMHAYSWICMHIHGYACLHDSSENTRIPLLRWFLMNCNYYKEKWKSRFDRKIEFWLGNTKSNRVFYWKPNMILWSLRSFWVERFYLNQS